MKITKIFSTGLLLLICGLPFAAAEDSQAASSMMMQKIDALSAKLEKMADAQKDIIKQLGEIKEELYIVKIRVTHRS